MANNAKDNNNNEEDSDYYNNNKSNSNNKHITQYFELKKSLKREYENLCV